MFPIHLVHKEQTWQTGQLGIVPNLFGANFNTGRSIHHNDGSLYHAHCRADIATKIGEIRRINHIDLAIVVLNGNNRVGEGGVPLNLFRVGVRGRGAQGNSSASAGGAAIKQHCLYQRRASCTTV